MRAIFLKKFLLIFIMAVFFVTLSCRSEWSVDIINHTGIPLSSPETFTDAAKYSDDGRRIITIGTWYDLYYLSRHIDIHDNPNFSDPVTAQMRLDNMRAVEKKYNIILNSVNLSCEGVYESITSSIPEGTPDVDIYEIELKNEIVLHLDDYAVSLEEMGISCDTPSDESVMKTLKVPGQDKTYLFTPTRGDSCDVYVLAFNMDMIREAGLENPQDLYDRGEWTWEKWREYLKILTKDADGDGKPEIYGYSGYWTNLLTNLLLSNGTAIASIDSGKKETLSSPETIEVLKFIDDIYNIDKTARPWDSSNWDINNRLYADGRSAFWIGSDWIFSEFGGAGLPFEIGVVPWPCGPNGNIKENKTSQPDNKWYFIPKNATNPELIYNIIYDWSNWYNGDSDIVRDSEWSRSMYMNDRNYAYAQLMKEKQGFDMWEIFGSDYRFSLVPMISGIESVSDVVQNNKQFFQNSIDKVHK